MNEPIPGENKPSPLEIAMNSIQPHMKVRCILTDAPTRFTEVEVLEWVVVRRSEKNAALLRLPGGEKWFRPGDFEELRMRFACLSPEGARGHLRWLSSVFPTEGNTLIPVSPAGKGSTPKIRKYKAQFSKPGVDDPVLGMDPVVERIVTLPVSQIVVRGEKHYAPAWLFRRHLRPYEEINGIWPGVDAVAQELNAAFDRLKERLAVRVAAWEAGAADRAAKREQEERLRLAREDKWRAEELAREERCRKRPAKVRVPDCVKENCTDSYPQFSTSGRTIRRVGEVTHTGCRVLFFGAKREILTPDGKTVVKLASPHLTIIPLDPPAGAEKPQRVSPD